MACLGLVVAAGCRQLVGIGELELASDAAVTDAAVADAAPVDAVGQPAPSPSCDGLAPTCGPVHDEECCATRWVPGGRFERSNLTTFPATVSGFYLDRFEVTIGRYRAFLHSGAGTRVMQPAEDAGEHPLIGEGSGWNRLWWDHLPATQEKHTTDLACSTLFGMSDVAGPDDTLPRNCVDWYLALAFCAWDGGRLPTEAEWNYAATGGDMQLEYPWGAGLDAAHAVYNCGGLCTRASVFPVGSRSPDGDGRWGHADLAGSVAEWVLDWQGEYPLPCDDCARVAPIAERGVRGGHLSQMAALALTTAARDNRNPDTLDPYIGIRCARDPK